MIQLHEQNRPRCWSEVVGQDKVLAKIDRLRKRGLAGRAYWLSGSSGTGKTTIARLIAAEVADDIATEELDATDCTPAMIREVERKTRIRPLGARHGWAFVVNESHGLRKDTIKQLLVLLERLPSYVVWCFTTTSEGQESLFEDNIDAHPLLSRCQVLPLARRDLAKPFAARARQIAEQEGLNGQPMSTYVKLLQRHRNNLRSALQSVEAGELLNSDGEKCKE